jgi:hypothetical protein
MTCEFTISGINVEVEVTNEKEFHILVDGNAAHCFIYDQEECFYIGEDRYKITFIDGRIALSRAEITWHLVTVKELS